MVISPDQARKSVLDSVQAVIEVLDSRLYLGDRTIRVSTNGELHQSQLELIVTTYGKVGWNVKVEGNYDNPYVTRPYYTFQFFEAARLPKRPH